jgi:hypothetical protein
MGYTLQRIQRIEKEVIESQKDFGTELQNFFIGLKNMIKKLIFGQ